MTMLTLPDGLQVEARFAPGARPGPAVVLLHEGLGSLSAWRDFPERVARATGLGTWAYSRLGYGQSDPAPLPRPVSFMHDEAAVRVPQVLAAMQVQDAILFGHSDGASIALLSAALRPRGSLRAVIAMAPHVFVEDLTITSIEQAKARYAEGDFRTRLQKHHPRDVDAAFRGWNDVWLSPEFRRWNLEPDVTKIEVPLLLVQGARDEYGTMAQIESIERHSGGPVETVVLQGSAHSPQRDEPEALLAAVSKFCASVAL